MLTFPVFQKEKEANMVHQILFARAHLTAFLIKNDCCQLRMTRLSKPAPDLTEKVISVSGGRARKVNRSKGNVTVFSNVGVC